METSFLSAASCLVGKRILSITLIATERLEILEGGGCVCKLSLCLLKFTRLSLAKCFMVRNVLGTHGEALAC